MEAGTDNRRVERAVEDERTSHHPRLSLDRYHRPFHLWRIQCHRSLTLARLPYAAGYSRRFVRKNNVNDISLVIADDLPVSHH